MDILYENYISKIPSKHFIAFQLKVKLTDGQYRSISYIQIIKKKGYTKLTDLFISRFNLKMDVYDVKYVTELVFCYKKLPLTTVINKERLIEDINSYRH